MINYRLYKDPISNAILSVCVVYASGENWGIPFDPANTDYQRFKQDIAEGAELQDADQVVMSPEQVAEFMETLP